MLYIKSIEENNMDGWKLTKVWQVDHKLVIADTINEAVELFKAYMGNDDEPLSIQAISTNMALSDYNALIKEDDE